MSNTLHNIYYTLCKQGYCSDKGTYHSYVEVYEELLAPYRSGKCLEIGLFNGHSLRMWEQYFSEAYGIDCDIEPHGGMATLVPMIESGEHNIFIFDATDEAQAREHFAGMTFDVIIEDANHQLEQQVELYRIYSKFLAHGGVYIIEDIDDLDATRHTFETLDDSKDITIIDRRSVKGRYDDVLILITDKK